LPYSLFRKKPDIEEELLPCREKCSIIPTIVGIVNREPARAAHLHEFFFFFLLFSSETATM